MIYGSVCSGIEAATQAFHPLCWTPDFFSEIKKFPSAVLAHHYPTVPNHGDMTKFQDWPDHAIDLLVGGTPCQSFSVAGLRKGLADPRGNLMLTFGAVAQRYRPNWIVWENVPGVLSSNKGRDFGTFLGMLAELGYGFAYRVLDAQYVRVGRFARAVPQRRRRVFVVGYLGDWRRAAAVLFDRDSLSGHPAPRREAGKNVAPTISARPSGGGGQSDLDGGLIYAPPVVPQAMSSKWSKGSSGPAGDEVANLVAHALRGEGFDASEDGSGRATPLVPVAFDCKGTAVQFTDDGSHPTLRSMGHNQSHQNAGGHAAVAFVQNTRDEVRLMGGDGGIVGVLAAEPGAKQQCYIAQLISVQGGGNASTSEADAGTLLSGVRDALGEEAFGGWGLGILDTLQSPEILRSALHGIELRPATFSRRWVVHCALSRSEDRGAGALQSMREAGRDGRSPSGWEPSEQRSIELGAYLSGLSQPGPQAERFLFDMWQASEGLGLLRQALSAVQEARRPTRSKSQPTHHTWAVRRMTAEECEFLQGFPRGFTRIPYRGKPADRCPDGPRYKALGNSMAVNVMAWIGERIALVDALEAAA